MAGKVEGFANPQKEAVESGAIWGYRTFRAISGSLIFKAHIDQWLPKPTIVRKLLELPSLAASHSARDYRHNLHGRYDNPTKRSASPNSLRRSFMPSILSIRGVRRLTPVTTTPRPSVVCFGNTAGLPWPQHVGRRPNAARRVTLKSTKPKVRQMTFRVACSAARDVRVATLS
ncbi:uspA -containing domain protein [Paraburkholderia fungorum]|jgi:hypothetical protein|uniref:UspA-containing domain protein n=1 Tax=Paraburkholderia fungorum TaxID=134537 RepID=A0AAU8T9U0_9BURK|nr:uspA -containing domain protein [Paraburkholderia fungorum]